MTQAATRGAGGAARQAHTLHAEGIETTTSSLGEIQVDLQTYGWFPAVLPSEEDEEATD